MIWACIAHGIKGSIIKLDLPLATAAKKGRRKGGGIGAREYVAQVLSGPLKDFVKDMENRRGHEMLVVEDGAPGHRSKLANTTRAALGIKQLTHPPSSPDLNPIEPLWLLLKTRVADISESRKSPEKLWKAVQQVWDGLTMEDIIAHTGKMDARVQAVKEAKGKCTKF